MFLKRFLIITLTASVLIIMSAQNARALHTDGLGLGIIVGEPTGISIKYDDLALGLAWSVKNHFHAHCDYWLHNAVLESPVNWFIGIGGKLKIFTKDSKGRGKNEDSRLGAGVRIPVGLQYYIINQLELFGELVPGISVYPSTSFDLNAGIGIRYYF